METTELITESETSYLAKNLNWWIMLIILVTLLFSVIIFLVLYFTHRNKDEITVTPLTSEPHPLVPSSISSAESPAAHKTSI